MFSNLIAKPFIEVVFTSTALNGIIVYCWELAFPTTQMISSCGVVVGCYRGNRPHLHNLHVMVKPARHRACGTALIALGNALYQFL